MGVFNPWILVHRTHRTQQPIPPLVFRRETFVLLDDRILQRPRLPHSHASRSDTSEQRQRLGPRHSGAHKRSDEQNERRGDNSARLRSLRIRVVFGGRSVEQNSRPIDRVQEQDLV